ncbi:MAG: hypothetical protein GX591_13830, partial [Planctomycetes bacterium]|nr:hypothetical protein [Planctomycetota bacterium]
TNIFVAAGLSVVAGANASSATGIARGGPDDLAEALSGQRYVEVMTPNPIEMSDVTFSASSFTYNGSNQKPTVTVAVGGTELVSGRDYTLANAGGVGVGDYTVTVVGKGRYEGTVTLSFSIVKALPGEPECVQLWEGGPYWATCNVGAAQPEESGYHFWWGDTVGYKRNAAGNGWVSAVGGMTGFEFTGANCTTYGKSDATLQFNGYIDETGNLVAAHDAATAHLGASWRMPTDQDLADLVANCTTTWITTNGVFGRLVTGTGDFASKSIFLPAAGTGDGSDLADPGSSGFYWSSYESTDPNGAINLELSSSGFTQDGNDRYFGLSVRPVCDTPPPPRVPYVEPVYVGGNVTAGIDHWVTNGVVLGNCTVVTSSTSRVTWTTGWYLVTNEVTLADGADCDGAVKLILADGGHLIANAANVDSGIGVGADSSLTIFAQPGGTGELEATGAGDMFSGSGGAGIGGGSGEAGSNITINGGRVTATGGFGAGIGGGSGGAGSDIAINGGSVTAMSVNLGDGIGSGYSGGTCTDIFVAAGLSVFAGADDSSASVIVRSGTDDLAATLSGQHYVKVVAPIAEGDVTLSASSFAYNGSNQKPAVTVTVDSAELEEGVDYTLTNEGGVGVGDYTVTVVGTGGYSGTVEKSFSITAKQITEGNVTLAPSSFAYNGSNQKPTVTVTVGGNELVSGTDYTLTNAGGSDLGDYTVTVVGTGNYEGTVEKSFSIVKADASITTPPTASAPIVKDAALSTISLVGGEASVSGAFAWASPETTVAEDGEFEVTFTPDDTTHYNPTSCWVEVMVKPGKPECVQLWEGGPYWATCNVGASAPQKYGYYFWWGDTVGYRRNASNDGWVSTDGQGTSIEFSCDDETAATTWAKDDAWLQNNGYIDETGNLVAEHDAATAKLGASWRMPTGQDFADLLANCTRNWTTNNGVNGWLVTGKDAFASKSIFLPVAGNGSGSDLNNPGSNGYYWSSTPSSQREGWSEYLCSMLSEGSQTLRLTYTLRNSGFSVRAVRDTPPPTPIPALPADPTATVVSNTVIEAGFADATVQDLIAGNPDTYNAFKTWAGTVADGEAAVVASAHAAASFQLRGAVASPTLFENEPTLTITDLTEGVSGWYITVELKDGDTEIQLRAATDAFANKVRKGNAVDAINTLCTSSDITAAVQEGSKKVKLTITPPAGGTGFFKIAFD